MKLLEENIGKTLSDANHSRILYDPPPRIMEKKAKINKLNLINGEGNGNPLQHSCLENSTNRGAWWTAVCSVAKSQTLLSD